MKKTIGIVGILLGFLLSFPVLADDNTPPPSSSPTPSATGNPPPAPGTMQRHDIRNDAQNYREADNDSSHHWGNGDKRHEEMKEHREQRRAEMKERREQHREKMKERKEHRQDQPVPLP